MSNTLWVQVLHPHLPHNRITGTRHLRQVRFVLGARGLSLGITRAHRLLQQGMPCWSRVLGAYRKDVR